MKKSPYTILEECRPAFKEWIKKRYERKPSLKFFFENHWACANKNGGHAILFGFQWSTGDYYYYSGNYSVDICILGFAFGITFTMKPRDVL